MFNYCNVAVGSFLLTKYRALRRGIRINKFITGASYAASTGSTFYCLKQLLDNFSSEQWEAIDVFGSLLLGVASFLISVYFTRREDKRKEAAYTKDTK
ncbi:class II holin family protein [Providencia sp. R33]|uniref:class II holin family protein n=1 Tax=Providencia sp. R33 TaxID=2828763 RepID=UPI001C5B28A0|nr:class II holin family protein [Providencia sp. R33]